MNDPLDHAAEVAWPQTLLWVLTRDCSFRGSFVSQTKQTKNALHI